MTPPPPTPAPWWQPLLRSPWSFPLGVLFGFGLRAGCADTPDEHTAPTALAAESPAGNAPSPAPAAAAPAAPAASPSAAPGPFDDAAQSAMDAALRRGASGNPIWIAVNHDDPAALRRAEEFASVFSRAGWQVKPLQRTSLRVRPGVFLFAADERPPNYVETARRAFEAAHQSPSLATGYRSYYEEMSRTRPEFRGFPFESDQVFLVVVGRVEAP